VRAWLTGILGLLLTLGLALLLLPSLIDWSAYRDDIAEEVQRVTGVPIAIEGDISVSLWSGPKISGRDVRLLAEGDLISGRIDLVSLEVSLGALLEDRLEVDSLAIEGADLWVAAQPDSPNLWREIERHGERLVARVSEARVSRSRLRFRGAQAGEAPLAFDGSVALSREGQTVTMRAEGLAQNHRTRIDAALRPLQTPGSLLTATVELPDLSAEVELRGTAVIRPDRGPVFDGAVEIVAGDPDALHGVVGRGLPPFLSSETVTATSEGAWTFRSVQLRTLRLAQGDLAASGSLSWDAEASVPLAVTLALPVVDVSSLAEPEALLDRVETALPALSQWNLQLALSVQSLRAAGIDARSLRLETHLRGGVASIEKLALSLPGGTEVALAGQLGLTETPGFSGTLSLTSDNFRRLLAWLDLDVESVAPERLRRLDLETTVTLTDRQVAFDKISGSIDASRFGGRIALGLHGAGGPSGQQPESMIDLSVDQVNLDAYLPESRLPTTAALKAFLDNPDTPEWLTGTRASLSLALGRLTRGDLAAEKLKIAASLTGSKLTLAEFRLEEIAGGLLESSGEIDLAGHRAQLLLRLSGDDPPHLARFLSIPPARLAFLGAFDLEVALDGSFAELGVTASLSALNGEAFAAGLLLPPSGNLAEWAVSLQHPDLGALLRGLGYASAAPGALAVDLSANLLWQAEQLQFQRILGRLAAVPINDGDLTLSGPLDRPRLEGLVALGSVAAAAREEATDREASWFAAWPRERLLPLLLLSAIDADLEVTMEAWDLADLRLENLSGDVEVTAGALNLENLTAQVNGGSLQGSASISATTPPDLTLDLQVDDLEFAWSPRRQDSPLRVGALLDGEASLTASGDNWAAIVQSLSGEVALEGDIVTGVEGAGEDKAAAARAIEANLWPGQAGPPQIGNVRRALAAIAEALVSGDLTAEFSFAIADGVLKSAASALSNDAMRAELTGGLDLARWRADFAWSLFLPEDSDTPYFAESWQGPLESATVRRSGRWLTESQDPKTE